MHFSTSCVTSASWSNTNQMIYLFIYLFAVGSDKSIIKRRNRTAKKYKETPLSENFSQPKVANQHLLNILPRIKFGKKSFRCAVQLSWSLIHHIQMVNYSVRAAESNGNSHHHHKQLDNKFQDCTKFLQFGTRDSQTRIFIMLET